MNGFEENKIPSEAADERSGGFVVKEASFKKKKRGASPNGQRKKDEGERYGFFSLRYPGVVLSFLFALVERISHGLKTGFFGRIFSSLYESENEKLQNGFLGGAFSAAPQREPSKRKKSLKMRFAALYENSLFCKLITSATRWIAHSFVRMWGVLFLSFGAMLEFIVCMRIFLVDGVRLADHFWIGAAFIVVAIPLLSSRARLGDTLLGGCISHYLLVDFCEMEEEKLESDKKRFGGYYSVAFFLGTLLGLMSYFISPVIFAAAFVLVPAVGMVIAYPEVGMMAVFALLPLTGGLKNPSLAIMGVLALVLLSFAFKHVRGKRVIRFEIIDVFVLIFGALMLFGGLISAGGRASLESALMYCGFISAYFLTVNIFRKKDMIYRSIKLMVVSTSAVAFIGIFEQGAATVNPSWIDLTVFGGIGTRVTSLFDNPNMLSIYLIIVFPFALYAIASAKTFTHRIFYILCAGLIALCTLYTWSRGAWLGIIVATCVFLVVYNIKNIWIIISAVVSLPLWSALLPDTVINRALSIGTLTDSSSYYRIYTWRGVWDMIKDHFFGGIGVGESAFSEVYPIYSYSGTETVMHSHNLFMEITVQLGVVGLLVFLLIMFFFAQKCFNTARHRVGDDPQPRTVAVAGLASICGALTMGLTDHIWYNYRVFLLFWAVIALTCAIIRIDESGREKERLRIISNNQSFDLDIDS